MNEKEYFDLFDPIINGENTESPYDNEAYINYTKLNQSRQNRWLKKGELSEELKNELAKIKSKQKWIIITEPWCGDAAHSIPFILKAVDRTDLIEIEIEIQLRDKAPFLIQEYLTNGGKSIPKLIVRNEAGVDLFTWGPRPAECQALMLKNKNSDLSNEDQKKAIQQWYNADKGESIQRELAQLIQKNNPI